MTAFLKELWKQIETDDALGLSAQCAYYFLLSMFPFLLFVVSLLGFLPVTSQDVLAMIKEYIPSGVAAGMETQLREVLDTKRGGTLSFGLIFSLVTASAAMDAIVLAVNKAYGLSPRKSFIRSRLLAMALTLAMLIVVFSALLLSVFGPVIGSWLTVHSVIPLGQIELWSGLRWVVNFAVLGLVFTGIYYVAPNTCLSCKDVIPGALIASAGWQLTSLGFSYYVGRWANYSSTYGSLGGVIVLMTWFYLSAFIIIIGGEINAMAYLFKKREKLKPGRA
ncbi:YihY/virulence factor BrkB family protein [Paenibacillus mucilaginosus]|uniref:Ribonuclease BN n=3 Tax=Paenibacillus mucilaginosus TaxID=61624 RepID=H6NN57_9BACL|nr:YihY/virulence factor BrkB family protein [Paenibacillus mucilaginosus]AFH64085.1 ribonuclease BN [Paenibacillus mucilaginosus K02]AEI44181.1 ribonuclease BN [Paenibacillus mucilaginosus KNP414]AFC31733.1 ribonuclease BN [Paenibacillus mucilaginosus 3016]MCG7212360.1 YihY/virulence factor BrkB family protein [Paenibacillus mucilaginosus]WDM25596.1 YihY/virulence factor BrkB family protein [Paenibacillus mucilaginosus]